MSDTYKYPMPLALIGAAMDLVALGENRTSEYVRGVVELTTALAGLDVSDDYATMRRLITQQDDDAEHLLETDRYRVAPVLNAVVQPDSPADPMVVSCPACGAGPHEPCRDMRSADRKPTKNLHEARITVSAAA